MIDHLQAADFIDVEPSVSFRLATDLVRVGELGFLSGIRAVDLHDERVPLPEIVEAQTEKIFANLDLVLQPVGLGRQHLVFVRIHLVAFERLFARMNKSYLACLGEQRLPARTCVGVSNLTREALIEMDFIVRSA